MQCPKCGVENKPDASACSSCYYDLSSTTAPVVPPPVDDTTRVQSPAPVAQPVNAQATVMGGPPPTYQSNPAPGTFPGQGFPMAAPQIMEYAGFWTRVGAYLIDGLILGAVSLALMVAFGAMEVFSSLMTPHTGATPDQIRETMMAAQAKLMPVSSLIWLIQIIYYVGLNGKYGATLGKMALGIKIVKDDGSPISYGTVIGRGILEYIFAQVTCSLAYLAVAFSQKKQGWHDMVMGTVVIHNR